MNMSITLRSRALAGLLGVTALVLGFLLLPAAPGSLAASVSPKPSASPSHSHSPKPSPSPTPSPKRPKKPKKKLTGTTVTGPKMWNPAKNRSFSTPSTVTVTQTTNLVNQEVAVSWTGFTPSSDILYNQDGTDYPVMVAECDTARPKYWSQCYGANNGGVEGSFGAFGPMNTAYATTSPDGKGELNVQILTALQNQFLNCGLHHECSLVIVPSQGGNTLEAPAKCADHSIDIGGTDQGQYAFSASTGQCSWDARIVVPLHFAPAPGDCPIKNTTFTALGSPMLADAMNQWIAKLCAGANPITITYNSSLTEPEAITDVPLGLGDIALTTRPGPADNGTDKKYIYAPVAISAVSIAYWIDNPVTGQPVTTLKLDPRLVAKLLTQSYDFQNEGCGKSVPPKVIGCDNAVDGNPFTLFADPEFHRLNPKVQTPTGYGGEFQIPTVEAGHSDMTWEVTRWIADNPDANSFMQGDFDPWGMHVNTDYLGIKYPLDSFTSQDSYPVIAHLYSPVFPLDQVAQYQAENWDPGTDWEKDQTGNFPKDPIEIPGERGLIAILDGGDAAAFRFPVAEILNDKGRYVAPTPKSMRAALSSLAPSGSNKVTEEIDYAKQKADAYPLTMVIYAMVPVSGVSTKKADAIARFLDYVAGPGQKPGVQPGELPAGYLPLPASMRAQTLKAATEVLDQSGDTSSPSPSPSASPSTGANSGASPSPAPSISSVTPAPTSTVGQGVVTIALKSSQKPALTSYMLPILLIVGGLAALAGASSLVVSTAGEAITARLRRARRVRVSFRRKP
jgi:ABC-type phosphate transport system substrate-binding protein